MRVPGQVNVELRPRDIALLRGLFESRVMTLAHIAALYFDGKREMAKKRVQKLKAVALVRERQRRLTDPSILFLTRKAFKLLRDNGHVVDYPMIGIADMEKRSQVSDLTLRHELEVMDVKAALSTAIRNTAEFRIKEFSTWPALYEFRAYRSDGQHATVKPDGFIRIEEKEADGSLSEHTFFLEVDRSHEILAVLCQKCHCYMDYYRSGEFAIRNGERAEVYKHFPFRVLVVCKTAKRRDNVARQLLRNTPPIFSQACLATINEAKSHPLKAIWVCPADFWKEADISKLTDTGRNILE